MTPLLQLAGIGKTFHRGGTAIVAARDIDLVVAPGEIVALVGESGSGKSTLARIALCLVPPDTGRVLLDGQDLLAMPPATLRQARRAVQPIFQDPGQSFNPRRTVAEALTQAMHGNPGTPARPAQRRNDAAALLERVGLRPVLLDRYPHELSGGQRQRLAVARAAAMRPRLIVADEPLSGADVSIRGQMLNLMLDLRQETGVAYLMITHDISVARAFADRVAVMHQGRIVETGPAAQVLSDPEDAYTQRLVASVPRLQ